MLGKRSHKLLVGVVAAVVLLLVFASTLMATQGNQDKPIELFAKLEVVPPELSTYQYPEFCDFTPDGSLYYIAPTLDEYGYARTQLMLISPNLEFIWNKTFTYVLGWAVGPSGEICLIAGHPVSGLLNLTMIEQNGKERWSLPVDWSPYMFQMAISPDGSVLIGDRLYEQENSTTARSFDAQGNERTVTLPLELRNTTLPIKMNNGTLTAQSIEWIYGISSDLSITWKIPLMGMAPDYYMSCMSNDRQVVCRNNLVFTEYNATNDGGVYCYDLEGNLLWKYPGETSEKYYYVPLIRESDGAILLLTQAVNNYWVPGIHVLALWPNGTMAWEYNIGYNLYILPVLYKDGMVVWNGTALLAISGQGDISWAFNLTWEQTGWSRYEVFVGPSDIVYLSDGHNISAIGSYTPPEQPFDWSILIMPPLLIVILVLVVYFKGKGMKDEEEWGPP